MQAKSIAECSQGGAFCNTFDLHLVLICLNDLCCVYLRGRFRQVLLHSPTIGNKIKYTNNLLKITLFTLDNSLKFAMKLKEIKKFLN